ncbi:MAG: hypothetical protein M5R36_22665 [Deltaproteobacteria bacterium]|nr:hypothetical protein [Deltaproteobacteria bacterium]
MAWPELYLSRPAVVLPESAVDNDETIDRVKRSFRGSPEEWVRIQTAIRYVFRRCRTKVRYLDERSDASVGEYAARAAAAAIAAENLDAGKIDLLIYAGIAREYFEPATAMEVAARLGASALHAFDVTSACVGLLEGIRVAAASMTLHEDYQNAVVCSAELTRGFLDYDIQSLDELATKSAGLTIGNAAAAFLVQRRRPAAGGARLLAADNYSLPAHWPLCTAPVGGTFSSDTAALFRLHEHVPPRVVKVLGEIGWTPNDVDHYLLHQPSESMVEQVMEMLGVSPDRAVLVHHLYANASSTTVALAMNERLRAGGIENGDRLFLSSAAAGFSMVSLVARWESGE